jgi:hypothetical protein
MPIDGGCAGGRMLCGGMCADLMTDPTNCGACGVICTDACIGGACCGDGKVTGNEDCDKTVGMGVTCATAVAPGWMGNVACTSSCKYDAKGCTAPNSTWNDFTNGSNWSTFDVASINGGARGFQGGVFDGRYLYAVPYFNGGYDGVVARYDTTGTFNSGASWSFFDFSSLNGNARGYVHGAFDGRYVYFVPNYNGAPQGIVARYDTTQGFGTATSWSLFDITTLYATAKGFQGAVFDGRYLYFIPGSGVGQVVRYDTKGGLGFSGSWSAFDVSTVSPNARNFSGGAFDGRYVYFAPSGTSTIARYDTQAQFGAMSAWQVYDLANVSPGAKGFNGALFDGKNVYLIPYNNGAFDGLVARFDTSMAFDSMTSWSTFDVGQVSGSARGFIGGAFDGKYIYMTSHFNGAYNSIIARYDTTAPFGAAPSWATFDTASINGNARGYLGAIFDGRYFYAIQYFNGAVQDGIIARLDAKNPPWLTKGWNASFF